MKFAKWKQILFVLLITIVGTLGVFVYEVFFVETDPIVSRNAHGGGKKTAIYELEVENEETTQEIVLDIEEQEYTKEETQELFRKVADKLDQVVLGENESFDCIEYDLHLVTEIEGEPIQIHWELSSYEVLDIEGKIKEENLNEKGTLVELRGNISYKDEQALYIRSGMIYPRQREGMEKLLYDIHQEISSLERETRTATQFELPDEIDGTKLRWERKRDYRWPYILLCGFVLAVFLFYREREKDKDIEKRRRDELMRMYPGMISKFTMLLSTGITVRNAWEKIVENYEMQKGRVGEQIVYEEMATALREIRGGIPEGEAYERFGKRCKSTAYMKFGTMLSQNLRKGSKGIADTLRMEAIQSFENRKSSARRRGEEAGAKLLVPMMGMLAIVLIMVMVPAFLNMQL